MITSKLTSKEQTTIPQPVRAALHLRERDEIASAIDGRRVVFTRVQADTGVEDPFLTFSEWGSQADVDAYDGPKRREPGEDAISIYEPTTIATRSRARGGDAETQGAPDLLWASMVTSAANRGWPGDTMLADHEAVGLPVPSVVRPAKIATIEADRAEPIGRLSDAEQVQISKTVQAYLAPILRER